MCNALNESSGCAWVVQRLRDRPATFTFPHTDLGTDDGTLSKHCKRIMWVSGSVSEWVSKCVCVVMDWTPRRRLNIINAKQTTQWLGPACTLFLSLGAWILTQCASDWASDTPIRSVCLCYIRSKVLQWWRGGVVASALLAASQIYVDQNRNQWGWLCETKKGVKISNNPHIPSLLSDPYRIYVWSGTLILTRPFFPCILRILLSSGITET
jgi:hypothetical protein